MPLLPPSIPFFCELDTNGDLTGNVNANVDGSVTPVTFKYTATQNVTIRRMIIGLEDNTRFTAEGYGGIPKLTNGVTLTVDRADGREYRTFLQPPVKSLAQWAFYCYDITYTDWGSGNNFATACWTFKESGTDIYLAAGDSIKVFINDDLTGLVAHNFVIEGVYGWVQPQPTTGPSNVFK